MTWFKVDDGFALHAKVVAAGNAAAGLWVRAGAWSAQQLTDGFVPGYIVPTLGTKAQAAALVRAGLWEAVDGGYSFWQWSERQPSRESVETERTASRERQRRARDRARQARDQRERPDVAPSSPRAPEPVSRRDDGVSNGEVPAASRSPRPDPTRPDPTAVPTEQQGGLGSGGESPPRATPIGPPSKLNHNPDERCPRHRDDPAPPPCGACGEARRAAEQRRRDSGLVVGGHTCPDHPSEPAGRCGRCAAASTGGMPEHVREQLHRRRAS